MRRQVVLTGFGVLMVLVLCVAGVSTAAAFQSRGCGPVLLNVLGPATAEGNRIIPCPTDSPKKASIVLRVADAPAGAWASVQWFDPAKNAWNAVPGWTGLLNQDPNGFMLFAVDQKDWATGPFRWVVYDKNPAQGGTMWAVTDKFSLPDSNVWQWYTLAKGWGLQ